MDTSKLPPMAARMNLKSLIDFLPPQSRFRLKYTNAMFYDNIPARYVESVFQGLYTGEVVVDGLCKKIQPSWPAEDELVVCDELYCHTHGQPGWINTDSLMVSQRIGLTTLERGHLMLLNPRLQNVIFFDDVSFPQSNYPLADVLRRLVRVHTFCFPFCAFPDPCTAFLDFCSWAQRSAGEINYQHARVVSIRLDCTTFHCVLEAIPELGNLFTVRTGRKLSILFHFPGVDHFEEFGKCLREAMFARFGSVVKVRECNNAKFVAISRSFKEDM